MSEPGLLKRSIAELIGTYVLVFLGTGSVVTTVLLIHGTESIPGNTFNVGIDIAAWFAIGISFAIAIIAMIYAFGHISGTHINPAVSIALWATGRFPAKDIPAYILAQLVGASLASFTLVAILGSRAVATGLGSTAMFDGVSYGQAILCEAVATFFLMLTIMGSAVDKRAPAGFAGLAIGLVVAADVIVVGNITGSSLNPARTFGPYLAEFLMGGTNFWWQFPIYIIGPIAGAVIAALLYDYVADVKENN
ncbi:MIP/aquaporin family protein [Methanolobus sp. WCC1]|jgi:glycerol uptake facilitator protein|uniref:MIP/aquaporin family protein n=1 Tax=unclassified Methanolobus TaxID=2629569 RepID=UPI0024ABAD5A|nr:MIP/aquaporin family protein [Methanolobus sp.]MDI3486569.1 glycerol uptake facilitator protein [Methanolobus sp.]MDK2830678.1 glycerol uptake facilitator protein [Methanolobus sp.]